MKRSSRLLIALVVIELLLGGIAMWLLSGISSGSMNTGVPPAEAAATITSTIGAAMGGLAGIIGVAWLLMRRRGL